MIQNKKTIIIIFGIAIAMFIVANITLKKTPKQNLEAYITKLGYKNEDDGDIYYKLLSGTNLDSYTIDVENGQESYYEMNYFNTSKYQFTKNKREYLEDYDTSLLETYHYKDNTISYKYRATSKIDDASIIFSGNYSMKNENENFTCNKDYSYRFEIEDNDDLVCEKIKNEIIQFQVEVYNTINNSKLLNEMRKG